MGLSCVGEAAAANFLRMYSSLRRRRRRQIGLELLNLVADEGPVLFVPGRDGHVVLLPVGDVGQVLQHLEAAAAGERVGHGVVVCGRGGSSELLQDVLLVETAAEAPVEEAAGVLPSQSLSDDTLGLHAAGAVVQIGELEGNLAVDG